MVKEKRVSVGGQTVLKEHYFGLSVNRRGVKKLLLSDHSGRGGRKNL